jgi:hypothetical protein
VLVFDAMTASVGKIVLKQALRQTLEQALEQVLKHAQQQASILGCDSWGAW